MPLSRPPRAGSREPNRTDTPDSLEDRTARHFRESSEVTVREFLERIINERDSHYDTRFIALEKRIYEALSAQTNAATLAFASSEKAVLKAEEAQKEYNIRSNEFRGQLDDQAKMLMPRSETNLLMQGLDTRLNIAVGTLEKRLDVQAADIRILRENTSGRDGAAAGSKGVKDESRANIAVMVSIGGLIITLVVLLLKN